LCVETRFRVDPIKKGNEKKKKRKYEKMSVKTLKRTENVARTEAAI